MARIAFSILASLLLVPAAGGNTASVSVSAWQSNAEPLPEAVVYAEPVSGSVPAPPAEAVVLNQKDERFDPHVLVVQRGGRVVFLNEDDINHHAYSFSPAKRFDLRIGQGEKRGPMVLDQTGEVMVGCNVHDWMLAYIYVVDTAWFGVTSRDGRLMLEGLPPGEYRLRLWHPRAREDLASHTVTVTVGDESVAHRFELQAPLRPARHQEAPEFDY